MTSEQPTILLVEDDETFRSSLRAALVRKGYQVREAESVSAALAILAQEVISVVLLDLGLSGSWGMDFLAQVSGWLHELPVIVLSGHPGLHTQTTIEATNLGAFDYLVKGADPEEVFHCIARAVKHRLLVGQRRQQDTAREKGLDVPAGVLIGNSSAMIKVCKKISRFSRVDEPVLIVGGPGTGKELVARAVHANSARSAKEMICVNSAAVPEQLAESVLFGHVKGAFTGAHESRAGLIESAEGSTLFLDEIGDMRRPVQARLLRVTETGDYLPVGSNAAKRAHVRLIAATNKNLEKAVRKERFRKDLLHRLKTHLIELPELGGRPEDIPLLADHFLKLYASANRKPLLTLEADALRYLQAYPWPGNVRELKHTLESAAALAWGEHLLLDDVQAILEPNTTTSDPSLGFRPLKEVVAEAERRHVRAALQRTRGNQKQAAKLLGIDRGTLAAKLEKLESSSLS